VDWTSASKGGSTMNFKASAREGKRKVEKQQQRTEQRTNRKEQLRQLVQASTHECSREKREAATLTLVPAVLSKAEKAKRAAENRKMQQKNKPKNRKATRPSRLNRPSRKSRPSRASQPRASRIFRISRFQRRSRRHRLATTKKPAKLVLAQKKNKEKRTVRDLRISASRIAALERV